MLLFFGKREGSLGKPGVHLFTHTLHPLTKGLGPWLLTGEGDVTALPSHSPPPIPGGQIPQGAGAERDPPQSA